MTLPEQWPWFLALGVAAGILSGSFGVGSGVIVVPILVHLAVPQKEAQGIALAVMVPMALLGSYRYYRNPDIHFDLRIAALIALTAVVGVLVGTHLAAVADKMVLRRGFAVLLVLASIKMWMVK